IAAARIPVLSAVGHETDVTIADFVADLRASTPSAAAELSAPRFADLRDAIQTQAAALRRAMLRLLEVKRERLKFWISHLKHPKKRLEELELHLDDLHGRLRLGMNLIMAERRGRLRRLSEKLEVLSPLSILSRGYSIVRRLAPDGEAGSVLKDADQAKSGDLLALQLWKGRLTAEVK